MKSKVSIPNQGLPSEVILEELLAIKKKDVPWRSGKVLAYVYEPTAETENVCHKAYSMYLSENGLDPTAFPSLLKLETELIAMASELLGGDEHTAGSFTSGGTESIMLAVKTARDYNKKNRPHIKVPEMIIPETAHAAFHKAAHYLSLKVVMLPVNTATYAVDPQAVKAAITENTVLIVGSAPSYAHGVIDPIVELGAIAEANDIFFHVDACVGGMYLPFAKNLGYDIPPFDFAVKGVTSISCDFHKYGYAAKGASCILYKNRDIRQFQIFSCSAWSGYSIVNTTVLSSKTGGPLAGAWATLNHIGKEGYKEIVDGTQKAAQAVITGLKDIPELRIMGRPLMNLLGIESLDPTVNIFKISDMMAERGWHLQVQFASNSSREAIHLSINRANVPYIPILLSDLKEVIAKIKLEDAPKIDFDPAMFAPMLVDLNVEKIDQLAEMLGMKGNNVPDKMEVINTILNGLLTEQRDALLVGFMNKLFTLA